MSSWGFPGALVPGVRAGSGYSDILWGGDVLHPAKTQSAEVLPAYAWRAGNERRREAIVLHRSVG